MLEFNSYNGRDLQNFMSMLNQCEAEGVTDVRFVRQSLQSRIDTMFVVARAEKYKHSKNLPPEIKPEKCPSCKNMTLFPAPGLEGMVRLGCKCGYSRIVK